MNMLIGTLVLLASCLPSGPVYYDYLHGQGFDLSALVKSESWELHHGDYVIEFMIGDKIARRCRGAQASVVRFYKDSLKCEILGNFDLSSFSVVSSINNLGAQIEYRDGDRCEGLNGKNMYSTFFVLWCSQEEFDFYLVETVEKCSVYLHKYSKAGCPFELIQGDWLKFGIFL